MESLWICIFPRGLTSKSEHFIILDSVFRYGGAGYFCSSGDVMISVTEIILIAAGVLAVIIGYLIPGGKEADGFDFDRTNQKINDMVSKAIKNSQGQIDEMLDDCMEEAINKAERAMDRVTNEKMSAISEYSDTVMNDIHKNHDEVVFMYDMLNDKHKNLKNTVSEANRATKEVKEAEAKRQAELEEEAKKQVELEAQAREQALREEEERRQAEREAEARRRAEIEAEAKRKAAEEEARLRAEEEAARQAKLQEETARQARLQEEAKQAEIEAGVQEESAPQFSSLADILDRADAVAAKKTQNRVIGSEPESAAQAMPEELEYYDNEPMELRSQYWPDSDENNFLDDIADEVIENTPLVQPEIQTAVAVDDSTEQIPMEEVPAQVEKPAKVVSISDATRKKTIEEVVVPNNDVISDPASRNQKILDMHKAGKSAVVIARELRLGIGEVKLVIDLAGKHKKNRSSIM
ncbi:hypothetical protein SAMN02910263_01893 [Butyrivibrio sp. INlla16]|nr:hypothetical protein SAMN02910263_01893 [Butyrivibrio sp. INlla16]